MSDHLKRYLIFAALALPIYIGTIFYVERTQKAYRQAHPAPATAPAEAEGAAKTSPASTGGESSPHLDVPRAVTEAEQHREEKAAARRSDLPAIVVRTDSFEVRISPVGAVPIGWDIIDPRLSHVDAGTKAADETTSGAIALIDPRLDSAGLSRPLEIVLKELNAKFYNELNSMVYEVEPPKTTEDAFVYRFVSAPTESGLRVAKTYTFPKQGFIARLRIDVENAGKSRLTFDNQGNGLGMTLGPGLGLPPATFGRHIGSYASFTAPIYSGSLGITAAKPGRNGEPEILKDARGGRIHWGALHDRYFMMSVAAEAATPETSGFTRGKARLDNQVTTEGFAPAEGLPFYPRLELYSDPFTLDPGQSTGFSYEIFAGPKERKILAQSGHGYDSILFYESWRWMRWLCFLLMGLLGAFHTLLKSWGLAIIALVVTVRLVTFPIAQAGLRSQAKMMAEQAKLKPHLDKINEKHKDDATKRQQEVMKLYREHNVNPLGMLKGCGWMIIQLPVFFALYKLLSQSIDLRGASFLWIHDLSQPDHLFPLGFTIPLLGGNHFNLLPLLVAASQFLMSKLSMNPSAMSDPNQAQMQQQMMYMMPVMMLAMTYSFPSGLALYWLISNTWQIFQQQFVNKKILYPATAKAAA